MKIKVTKRPKIGCVVRATGKALRFFSAVLFVTGMTISATACSAETEYDEPEMPTTEKVQAFTQYNIPVNDDERALLAQLVEMSLWCEDMSNDLRAEHERLWDNVTDPDHNQCVSCNLEALKFFSEHEVFWDTTGESCAWEKFQMLLDEREDLRNVWNNIKL